MGTDRAFQAMLNEYVPNELLATEFQKRDYVLQSVSKDNSWKGGDLLVPFEGQHATSIEFGQLASSNDVSQHAYVRGKISTQPEAWGTMKFHFRDLVQHNGKIPESTFLKIIPNQINDFLIYMKMVVSVNMLNGSHFAKFTVDGTVGGVIEVDRIDRFALDQKLYVDDSNSAPLAVYVIAIDINGGTLGNGAITVSATRGGAAADVSAYTVAQNAKCYHPGAQTSSFTSIRDQLLSAANGGSASLFGQTKTAFPYLQAVQIDGSGCTSSNLLQKIFDGYTRKMLLGRAGTAGEILMSWRLFGVCMRLIETSKGAFNVVPGSRKASQYGWDTIEIGSVSGQMLKLVGIQELDHDVIMYLDWDSIKLYTNGMFRRVADPDGNEYYKERATTGYVFLLDQCFFGEIAVLAPWKNAIMHSIPSTVI